MAVQACGHACPCSENLSVVVSLSSLLHEAAALLQGLQGRVYRRYLRHARFKSHVLEELQLRLANCDRLESLIPFAWVADSESQFELQVDFHAQMVDLVLDYLPESIAVAVKFF